MTKRDWLLLFASASQPGTDEPSEVDPIRIQKGLFLFAMETKAPRGQKYRFRPYNYGACSFEIYGDLDALVAEGSLERIERSGQSWPLYRTTDKGAERARKLMSTAPQPLHKAIRQHKEFVFSRGFLQMLREIYEKYPAYAAKSVLKF